MREPDWNQIVNEIGPCLFRYFSGAFPSAIASDLVQESLIRLVKKYRSGEFDPTKGTVKSYAYGIAKFVRLEAQKIHPEFDLVDDESILDVPLTSLEKDPVADLRAAIHQLKPAEKDIILLQIDRDLRIEDIALQLGIPVGTVKSHIHRAKENLRQIMEVKK